MRKYLILLALALLVFGLVKMIQAATSEAVNPEAQPFVLYGKNGNSIVAIKVDATGAIVVK